MREISPAVGMSVDDWMRFASADAKGIVEEVRRQKREGLRPRPLVSLIDRSALMTETHRKKLLDAVASLVDENYAGRSEMCFQFADLLHRALSRLKFPSRPAVGVATYYGTKGEQIFYWSMLGASGKRGD